MPAHAQRMRSLLASDKEGVFCRVARRGHTVRGEVRAGRRAGKQRRCTQHAGERARLKDSGARARAERTRNISYICVTLDVSKLSGWLNALAPCRVERRACDARRGAGWEA